MMADERQSAEPFLRLLEKRAPRPLTITEMARMLELERYDRKRVKELLEEQVAKRRLRRIGKSRFQWLREEERATVRTSTPGGRERGVRSARGARAVPNRVEGRYVRVRAGFGFVEVLGRHAEAFRRDVFIPEGEEGGALHGDRVLVEITRRDRHLHRTVGRVVEVTGSAHEHILGTLQRRPRGWCLIPESELLPTIELVGDEQPREQDSGLVAVARLTAAATATRPPRGVLERVVGKANDPEVQFLAIAYEHGLRVEFPDDVLREAERLPADPSPADFAGREDLRDLPFVTIDGETARDFDDAVWLEEEGDGYHLRVAIADVSHYVTPGSALDAEAARRGTSVYFPDRAIPMLPPQLSNQLCSLNPERDRLVLVADMHYDAKGGRRDSRVYRAVMRSRARLTYTKVAAVLGDERSAEIDSWRDELSELLPQLRRMHVLMKILYRKRVGAGSLDLDLPEALVDISEEGRSVGVRLLVRNDAHRIIEELMLEANQAVAIFLRDQRVAFPYRVHEPPENDSIDELNQFLGAYGFHVAYDDRVTPSDVQQLLDRLKGHRLERVLSRQVLRSLTQAQYSTVNGGHFGLAFPIYCHFTSPIRRYPDLLVHRQLGRLFDGARQEAVNDAEAIEAASVASSQAEREAMEAERAMLDLKKAEFMLDHLLEPEPGTIVSVLPFGFFVELDKYPIEGLVRIDDLRDDRYRHIERERALVGVRKRQRLRLGDRVLVEATNVSLPRRQIDLALLKRL